MARPSKKRQAAQRKQKANERLLRNQVDYRFRLLFAWLPTYVAAEQNHERHVATNTKCCDCRLCLR